jgi:hypothetical protein
MGSVFEYDLYYFQNYYKVDEDQIYRINPEGGYNYRGMYYRTFFSILCIISAFMSIYSNLLEFRLEKLQGAYFEGRIN